MEMQKRNNFKSKIKNIASHPYFGYLLAGFIFLVLLLLYEAGIVKISTFRAAGQTIIYFIIALGFTLLLGYSGLASLGTAGFIGLGTYAVGSSLALLNVPVIVAFAIAVVVAVVIGGVVGFISLRIEGMYLAIITLGLSEILNEVFKNATKITNGVNGLQISRPKLLGFITANNNVVFAILIIMMVVAMIITANIINSPTGRAMLSMKNSTSAAQAMGISLLKYRLLAFVLATIYAVLGGGLYMLFYRFSIPTTWNLALSLNILAAVVVGGAKSIWGVFLGTFLIFGFDLAILRKIPLFIKFPNATLLINGALIIIIVMFYPGGLIELIRNLYYKIKLKKDKATLKARRKRYGLETETTQNQEEYINQQRQKITR